MKDDEVQRYVPPMKNLTIQDDVSDIINYLQGDTTNKQMSVALKTKYDRFIQVADWIRKYGARHKVIPMITSHNWLDAKGESYSVSPAQAYRDFNDAQQVFSVTQVNSKMFWIDMLLGFMVETRSKALAGDKKDFKTAAAVEKNMMDAITTHFGDKDAELYKKLIIPQIIITTDPTILGRELPADWKARAERIVKRKMMGEDFIDVPFTEEKDDDQR